MSTMVMLNGLGPLVATIHQAGYRIIGPTISEGTIVLAELDSADALPYGWGADLEPGGYQLKRRNDLAAFSHAASPQSWKTYLHPPRVPLWSGQRDDSGDWTVTEAKAKAEAETPRYAFLGVRACDLRAIGIQDRVLGRGAHPDRGYAARRANALIIAVNCTEPGSTCFCASAGAGPRVKDNFDLVLTELPGEGFLAEAGSPVGSSLLAQIPYGQAEPAAVEAAQAAVSAAADRMERTLPEVDLRELLSGASARDARRWHDIAERCLSCGNCTMVCPTCFCTTVEDTTDLTGDVARRWQRWDSCFDLDFSHLHDGPVRSSRKSRYRQWLTHKFSAWHDQFGESGCVGCGRCIVWCPVGIDITEEAHALAAEVTASENHKFEER